MVPKIKQIIEKAFEEKRKPMGRLATEVVRDLVDDIVNQVQETKNFVDEFVTPITQQKIVFDEDNQIEYFLY